MADDWEDVAAPAAAPAADDGWEAVPKEGVTNTPSPPISGAEGWTSAAKPMVNSTSVGGVMKAFGQGFNEASGPEKLGLSDDSIKWLSKIGIFAPEGQKHFENPFQAFNEGVILPTAAVLDGAMRMFNGTYRGLQSAGVEAGLPGDVVSIPDAFMGSPHAMGEIKARSGLPADRPVGRPLAEMSPSAPVAQPGFDAYHGSPYSFDAFSTQHIGTGEGAQSFGHGLYFAENSDVAGKYAEKLGGDAGNSYQVRVNVDPDKMLDLDVSLNGQTAFVQDAVKKAMGIDYYGNFDQAKSDRMWNEHQYSTGKQAVRQGFIATGDDTVTQRLSDAGIPGSRYLDEGSRPGMIEPPAELIERREDIDARLTAIRSLPEDSQTAKISSEFEALSNEKDQINSEIAKHREQAATRNFVIFNEGDIQITHKNGEPIPTPQDAMNTAHDLGVIGPEKPTVADLAGKSPEEIAATLKPDPASAAASARTGDKVTQELPGADDPWQQRFDKFVGKLNAPDDVKQLIQDASSENGQFPAARRGDIPLSDVENIAEAAGVDPATVDQRGLGRTLQNDTQVRTAMRMMLQVTNEVSDAAREVRADNSPENLIKLQEAIMRRDMSVEQVVGLRAEWGRTGGVFQEFQKNVKDAQGLNDFLKDKGRTPADLKEIADGLAGINDPAAAARILNNTRGKQMSPFYYTWVNGLISGLLTHTKYVAANAVYAASEHGVTTPIAALIGEAKKIAGVGTNADRVFFGETAASMWGMLAATPTALIASGRSIKAGVRAPLESEVALRNAAIAAGERIPASLERAVNPLNMGERPIPGVWGRIIGVPGDVAGAIHTFFKILGERAGVEAEAYRKTAQEGLSPTDDQFWQRRANHAANPTDEMRQRALEGAYKGTFMQELGPRGKAWQKMTKDIPGMKWIFPFAHIPINLMKATYEHTPGAILDSEMRADITGQNGGIRQDKAIARMVVGSSIMGWFVNAQMTGKATGDLPKDPKERDQWNLAGKQPNSILIGDHWVSYARFGPAGDLAALGANIGTVIHHLKSEDDDAMTKATMHAVLAAGKLVIDEAGFQSLQNIFEAYQDPDRRGAQFVASEASSLMPFSSLLGQTASFNDPNMREAKTFIDGLKYRIPGLRETLLPKRDWSGLPIPNPQYGNILRQTQVKTDPVDQEMATLGLHPAPPQSRIHGVKLPPAMYDTYQATAGPFTRTTLSQYVNQPGWHDMPLSVRQEVFKSTIKATREAAATAMQMKYPQIIQQGVQDRMAKIQGQKPGKLSE